MTVRESLKMGDANDSFTRINRKETLGSKRGGEDIGMKVDKEARAAARKSFKDAKKAARKKYDEVVDLAWKVYKDEVATARKVRKEATAAAKAARSKVR
jgi:hypothetical protein